MSHDAMFMKRKAYMLNKQINDPEIFLMDWFATRILKVLGFNGKAGLVAGSTYLGYEDEVLEKPRLAKELLEKLHVSAGLAAPHITLHRSKDLEALIDELIEDPFVDPRGKLPVCLVRVGDSALIGMITPGNKVYELVKPPYRVYKYKRNKVIVFAHLKDTVSKLAEGHAFC